MELQTKKSLTYLLKHFQICKGLNFSFSQEGEDMIVDNLLRAKSSGFYVDFGAFHPFIHSNTMRFYAKGWSGLNVDAMPGSMKAFKRLRPRDINVESGISDKDGVMTYYRFEAPELNSFDSSTVDMYEAAGCKCIDKVKVEVHNPMFLLDRFVPENTQIDIMDIDIEGLDDVIIDAIDWKKYTPTIVLAEKETVDINSALSINNTLASNGYKLVACTERTSIYKKC